MKLADLIPGYVDMSDGWNGAVDAMAALVAQAEAAGYRLVLAMPQHPISEDDDQ